jgi:hypothetical protein
MVPEAVQSPVLFAIETPMRSDVIGLATACSAAD